MPLYESVFIARQDISAQQAESLTEQFSTLIKDNGGTVGKTEYWGLRTLSYKIKKNRKGHYTLINLDAPAAAMQELERQYKINEDILRFMTIKVDELEETPSIMMQNKYARSDRGDRGDRGGRGDRGDRGPRRDRDSAPRGESSETRSEPTPTEEKA
ncbi:30S ribosomal protein S6 [Oceanibacterium hippocampi]|uniref:Small ribosomal subunit protein bS6 n=1 Tax=Oceanibacterium hippocampi TaxID=745714 RepID=A0A1Y5STU3_9PROT|nr:30S ribosomal protein S6 [Oceanibacterium hippocampi]SLN48177.1 30S ribosomal protein S6 [Oceanibacterium hippocampi]